MCTHIAWFGTRANLLRLQFRFRYTLGTFSIGTVPTRNEDRSLVSGSILGPEHCDLDPIWNRNDDVDGFTSLDINNVDDDNDNRNKAVYEQDDPYEPDLSLEIVETNEEVVWLNLNVSPFRPYLDVSESDRKITLAMLKTVVNYITATFNVTNYIQICLLR